MAGRGFGKTRATNEWAIEQARKLPGSRGALVAATREDVRDVIMEGESGIMNISPPDFYPQYIPNRRLVRWPNGSIALTFSADVPNRLRGPQQHWAICDELAAWRYPQAFDMLTFGTRLGDDPRIVISTTPRPTPLMLELALGKLDAATGKRTKDPSIVLTGGSTYANRGNLAPKFFTDLIRKYEGTTLGQQELLAILLTEVKGALWTLDLINRYRMAYMTDYERRQFLETMTQIVVAVDPPASSHEGADEAGIIVNGKDRSKHGYVLDDRSAIDTPAGWAKRAIDAYLDWDADKIIAEKNNGGEMVEYTISATARALNEENPAHYPRHIPIKLVHASRGKRRRAQPVSAFYEQGMVHHVGVFSTLEDQMTTWVEDESDDSPDRMDANVWGLSHLLVDSMGDPTTQTRAEGLFPKRQALGTKSSKRRMPR